MDVGVVLEQPFLGGVVEIRPVIDGCHLRGGTAKYFWAPCFGVREMAAFGRQENGIVEIERGRFRY